MCEQLELHFEPRCRPKLDTPSVELDNTAVEDFEVDDDHTSYLSILVHRRIIEVYKKYTKKLSELATK